MMTELSTPDRDDDVGQALRGLDVGASRHDFWDDVRSDLVATAEGDEAIVPHCISGSHEDGGVSAPNRRRTWSSKPWLTFAAAAAILLIVGLAVLFRPGGDSTTQLDVANPGVANPEDPEGPATSTADTAEPVGTAAQGETAPTGPPLTGGADGTVNLVDYSQPPTAVTLPAGSLILAGAPSQDLVITNWPVPGTAAGECEDRPGHYALLPVISSGQALVDKLTSFGGRHDYVEASTDLGVLTNRCGDQAQLAQMSEQGEILILAWLQIPEGQQLKDFPAVWSHDESQFYLHVETESGIWSLLTFEVAALLAGPPFAPSAVAEISTAEPRRLVAELEGAVRVMVGDGVIVVDGEIVGPYREGTARDRLYAERSVDTTQVAIAGRDLLTIVGADGVVASFETGGPAIYAMDWSTTGQLLFSSSNEEGGVQVYTPGASDGDAFSTVANTRGVVWLELEVADNGTVLALSGWNEFAQAKVLRFPGNSRVLALDPDERLVTLQAPTQTVGDQPLTLRGIGAIEAGMTVAQAEEATGGTLIYLGGLDGCGYAALAGDPLSPAFMVITYQQGGPNRSFLDGVIERIELGPGSATLSGIGVGSTEDEVRAAYGERIEVSPHQYTFEQGGEYFTFVPADSADGAYRVVMETFDDKVTQVRSGLIPAVEFVEGCA